MNEFYQLVTWLFYIIILIILHKFVKLLVELFLQIYSNHKFNNKIN